MTLPCMVIIANICINSASAIKVDQSSIGFWATVKGNHFEAEISANLDNISTPDWSKMNEACAMGVCIAYFKHCSKMDGSTLCAYHYSQPGDMQNTVIRIKATDSQGIQNAEASLGVYSRAGPVLATIPLSKFVVESETSSPPYCGRRGSQSSCWPAPRART